jgi:hypothetical protein
MNYTLEIQEDSNGDYFIEFPTEIVEALGWTEGDILEWKLKGALTCQDLISIKDQGH